MVMANSAGVLNGGNAILPNKLPSEKKVTVTTSQRHIFMRPEPSRIHAQPCPTHQLRCHAHMPSSMAARAHSKMTMARVMRCGVWASMVAAARITHQAVQSSRRTYVTVENQTDGRSVSSPRVASTCGHE
jgi:hypothetical protein